MSAMDKASAESELHEDLDLRTLGLTSVGGGEARDGEYTGTKALMMAVLDNGIQSFLGSQERYRAEAEHWVMTRQRRGPFCFTVVCETLGLDPDAVRAALQRWQATKVSSYQSIGRRRPTVRRRTRIVVAKRRR
jgi:hypothetical protein